MASCSVVAGKPEFYGAGIRVSFYLLWTGITISRWICDPTLFLLLLGTHFVFASAVTLGLLVSLATSAALSAAEVCVVLLLVSTLALYTRLPYYIWRVATVFRPDLDFGLYHYHLGLRERADMPGPYIFGVAETILMLILVGAQLWFWSAGVDSDALVSNGKDADGSTCRLEHQVGFVFKSAELTSPGLRAFNAIIIFAVTGGTVVTALVDSGCIASEGESRSRKRRRRRRERRRMRDARIGLLKLLQTACDLAVTPILVSAVELTIAWNDIPDTGRANTAAQLIPLLIGVILLTMVIIQLVLSIHGLRYDGGTINPSEDQESGNDAPELEQASPTYMARNIYTSAVPVTPSSTTSPICTGAASSGSVPSNEPSSSSSSDPAINNPGYTHPRDPPCSYT